MSFGTTWIYPEGIISRVSQIPYDFTYMWTLKAKQRNKQNKSRFIDVVNERVLARKKGDGQVDEGVRGADLK